MARELSEVSPAVLTQLMGGSEALTRGAVERADIIDRKVAGAMGSVHSLALRYTQGSAGALPARVILKRTRPDVAFSPGEVRFYRSLLPRLPAGTAPRCLGGVYDDDTRQYALILEDLSETHTCLLGPGLPAIGADAVGMMMDRLATLHAAWWEQPLDGFGRRAADPARTTRRVMPRLAEAYPERRELLGDALSREHDRVYTRYFAERAGPLAERLDTGRAFALLHGDAHVGNFLFPRADREATATLIDWGGVRVGPALWDISFPLMWVDPDCWTRGTSEALLRRYHAGLEAGGVRGYSFETCREDFRAALLDNLRAPISQLLTPQVPLEVPRGAHRAAMALIEAWDAEVLLGGRTR